MILDFRIDIVLIELSLIAAADLDNRPYTKFLEHGFFVV
jgi:hypothetical protein